MADPAFLPNSVFSQHTCCSDAPLRSPVSLRNTIDEYDSETNQFPLEEEHPVPTVTSRLAVTPPIISKSRARFGSFAAFPTFWQHWSVPASHVWPRAVVAAARNATTVKSLADIVQ